MNWEALGAIAELVGAVGVILTLGYLAVQIRQNTRSVRTASYQAITTSMSNYLETFSRDRESASMFLRGLEDLGKLDDEDALRFVTTCMNVFNNFENLFYQQQQTMIETEFSDRWTRVLRWYLRQSGVVYWWQNNKRMFSETFQQHVDGQLASVTLQKHEAGVNRWTGLPKSAD
jgi:hypothetical protein